MSFNQLKTIDPSVLKTPVTLNIDITGISGTLTATQNGVLTPSVKSGNTLTVNVYPNKGSVIVKTTAAPPPNNNLGCLQASYFNNNNLTGTAKVIRFETAINNNWGAAAPNVTGIPADNFSIRWLGSFTAAATGTYQFKVTADDGVRLWVNNVLVINQWRDQSATSYTASVSLTKGVNYPIKMEYYEKGGQAVAQLAWTEPSKTSKIMPFAPNCTTLNAQSVQLLTLDGRVDNTNAKLQWVANTPREIDYFQIEKRNEQGEFTPLSIVNENNQNQIRLYDFVDSKLFEGNNEYRIQTVFVNPDFPPQYSAVLTLHYIKASVYNVFPNPAQDNVQIDLSEVAGKRADIHIFSIIGKELYSEKIESVSATPYSINISHFEIGSYMIQINVAGRRSVTRKLVVNY